MNNFIKLTCQVLRFKLVSQTQYFTLLNIVRHVQAHANYAGGRCLWRWQAEDHTCYDNKLPIEYSSEKAHINFF